MDRILILIFLNSILSNFCSKRERRAHTKFLLKKLNVKKISLVLQVVYNLQILIRLKSLEHSVGWAPVASTAWTSWYTSSLWPDEVTPRPQYWEWLRQCGNYAPNGKCCWALLGSSLSVVSICKGGGSQLRVWEKNCSLNSRLIEPNDVLTVSNVWAPWIGGEQSQDSNVLVSKLQKTMQVIGKDSCATCSTREDFQEWEEKIWHRKLINWCYAF